MAVISLEMEPGGQDMLFWMVTPLQKQNLCPCNTLAQKAELITLTQAIIWGRKGCKYKHRLKICLSCLTCPCSYLERERTAKCKKLPYKVGSWDFTSHRSGPETRTGSSHPLLQAPKGKFSNFQRKRQGSLGSKRAALMPITKWL